MPAPESLAHRPYEDVQGLLTGTLFIALGTLMFSQAKLLTGGTAGIALLISYLTGWPFGPVFFAVNLPFYLFAWKQMGKGFTLRTAAAVSLMTGPVSRPTRPGRMIRRYIWSWTGGRGRLIFCSIWPGGRRSICGRFQSWRWLTSI